MLLVFKATLLLLVNFAYGGTIFFHFVKESDLKPNRFYTCTAENIELKDYNGECPANRAVRQPKLADSFARTTAQIALLFLRINQKVDMDGKKFVNDTQRYLTESNVIIPYWQNGQYNAIYSAMTFSAAVNEFVIDCGLSTLFTMRGVRFSHTYNFSA
ncbi:hypothetical protein DICVIV_03966 [Dictyocaulus viviparus]|uniref:Uncharacterized protein n=1 Tax=Dictyocaulus viviparus TaxID=29172 RepID=A0A0D8XZG4_DICVI|nr:hypothetical protein DICVIV_03966 [Dictyocaulus viviparus]